MTKCARCKFQAQLLTPCIYKKSGLLPFTLEPFTSQCVHTLTATVTEPAPTPGAGQRRRWPHGEGGVPALRLLPPCHYANDNLEPQERGAKDGPTASSPTRREEQS